MEEKPSTARLALKWGLIAGVTSMIYNTGIYLTSQFTNNAFNWFGIVFSVLFIVMAIREYRTLNGGFISYGEGVSLGTLTTVIGGFISVTYNYIYTNFIDATIQQQIMDKVQTDMENRGMSDQQIQKAMEISQKFQSPGLLFIVGIFAAALIGLLISLIVSAFMRRNKPAF